MSKCCAMIPLVFLWVLNVVATDPKAEWKQVNAAIDKFSFLPDAAFSAGDRTGRKHTYSKGKITMQSQLNMASTSKFPATVAIGGVIKDGYLGFETLASDVFEWWTTDVWDLRSRVRLAHLLGFVSGLTSDDFSDCGMKCLGDIFMDPELCAKEIYNKGPWNYEPNTTWSYHSLHLQIAAAMAAKAAKIPLQEMFYKYLLTPLGMSNSYWLGWNNTHVAAALVSTGDDYEKMLMSVLNYEILPKPILDRMQWDSISDGVGIAPNGKDYNLVFTYGHYSMGLYFECVNQPWSKTCLRADIHADPGAFGYWPVIDTVKGYFMQIVTERHPVVSPEFKKKYNISDATLGALPASCTYPLRFDVGQNTLRAMGINTSGLPGRGHPNPIEAFCNLVNASESTDGTDILV